MTATLELENVELRRALAFYADESNWHRGSTYRSGVGWIDHDYQTDIWPDHTEHGYEIAQRALAGEPLGVEDPANVAADETVVQGMVLVAAVQRYYTLRKRAFDTAETATHAQYVANRDAVATARNDVFFAISRFGVYSERDYRQDEVF